MLADSFTKPLPKDRHLDHATRMGLQFFDSPHHLTSEGMFYWVIVKVNIFLKEGDRVADFFGALQERLRGAGAYFGCG